MMSKAAYEQKRKISAQIRVRFNTTTTRIELADATAFGGPTGTYRMRVDRRWCDAADGSPWFITRHDLGTLVTDFALGQLSKPSPHPELTARQRVRAFVRLAEDGSRRYELTWTITPPILGADGLWHIAVNSYRSGPVFLHCDDVSPVIKAQLND